MKEVMQTGSIEDQERIAVKGPLTEQYEKEEEERRKKEDNEAVFKGMRRNAEEDTDVSSHPDARSSIDKIRLETCQKNTRKLLIVLWPASFIVT